MSSLLYVYAALLAVAATLQPQRVTGGDDFAFDVADDLEVEFNESGKLWDDNKEITAIVGRMFHMVVPKMALGRNVQSYEVREKFLIKVIWKKQKKIKHPCIKRLHSKI